MTESRARRNGIAPYMLLMPLVFIDDMQEAQYTARLSGAAGTAAASADVASWDGCPQPGGAGQRQSGWLCAKHDRPPGRPSPDRKITN
jgi:hypothetical protein